MDLNIRKCDVYGTLALGSSTSDSIEFRSALNIIVYSTGTVVDNTRSHVIRLPERALFTMYPGASFQGVQTVIQAYSISGASLSGNTSIVLGSSFQGPKTCGILPGGQIEQFSQVTYIVTSSGDFNSPSTWLGGIVPTADVCSSVGGCGMSVSTGYTLSTASLNGECNINFNVIRISVGAILQLGTSGSSAGFKFRFLFQLNCYGILSDVTGTTGGIFVPPGSTLSFFEGSSFSSLVATVLRVYNPTSNVLIGTGLVLSTSFRGPFFIYISITGEITTSSTSNQSKL